MTTRRPGPAAPPASAAPPAAPEQPAPPPAAGPTPAPAPRRRDETVPGGRFLVNGRLVNAQGEPIEEP